LGYLFGGKAIRICWGGERVEKASKIEKGGRVGARLAKRTKKNRTERPLQNPKIRWGGGHVKDSGEAVKGQTWDDEGRWPARKQKGIKEDEKKPQKNGQRERRRIRRRWKKREKSSCAPRGHKPKGGKGKVTK